MKVLVTGATGTVGGHVVRGLRENGADVFAMTRSEARARDLEAGVSPIVGSLLDPVALRSSLRGIDAMFLLLAGVPSEAHEGLTAVALAKEAGIKKIVYLSVHQNPATPRHVPHIGSKLLIESVIRGSGIPFTFIQPNFFMQNDYWVRDSITERGSYPFPLGDVGVSGCDVRDIADVTVASLMQEGHEGHAYTIAGPRALTGEDVASVWSDALGRTVVYGGHDMPRWEAAQVDSGMPAWQAFDLNPMFQAWQKGLIATPAELDQLERLLGRPPRTYESFARETAHDWSIASGG